MQEIRKLTNVFRPDAVPAAHVKDGEVLLFSTVDCYNGTVKSPADLVEGIDDKNCDAATGPVYIDGAEPGDVIAVDILDVQVADHGVCCTMIDEGVLWPQMEQRTRIIPMENGYAVFNDVKWPVHPMIGVIGTALADREISTEWVHEGGGNMDSNKITKGSTLWLPVRVPGALLAMGDVHATMGDGEVVGNGLETAANIIVRVRLVKHFLLNWPVTELDDRWYVNTCGPTCDDAIEKGYLEMFRLLKQAYGWDGTDVGMYMSLQGFVEANQAVLNANGGGNSFRVGTPKRLDKPRLIPG